MEINFENLDIKKGERVIVAMSGGVDSSVTALIAKQAGAEVIGITLKMFDTKNDIYADAKRVADQLDIEHHLADYSVEFNNEIISYFIREYKFGRTPNPCSRCNRMSKTVYLYNEMLNHNATKIITGHYAKSVNVNGQMMIKKAKSKDKDQSYYLALIDPIHVNYLRFVLGDYEKSYVRKIATENNLLVAEKTDSQDICFLEGGDYREFIAPFAEKFRHGNFILNGEIIGKNEGVHNYTVGQRRGLDISYSEPLYVKEIDAKSGDVYLGIRSEINEKIVDITNCNFYPNTPNIEKVTAKLRYRMNNEPCILERLPDNNAKLLFDEPQFAPAKGQTVAIYSADTLLGGGIIK